LIIEERRSKESEDQAIGTSNLDRNRLAPTLILKATNSSPSFGTNLRAKSTYQAEGTPIWQRRKSIPFLSIITGTPTHNVVMRHGVGCGGIAPF
jgi:hypothetical protein